jgi:phosphate/sulfate permease
MEITDINDIERAMRKARREMFRFGMALLFIIAVMLYTWARGGGDVVQTIRGGIIAQDAVASPYVFVWLMMAALLAGAI